jgi:hypothetical protein
MKVAVLEGFSRYEIVDTGIVRYKGTGLICPHYDDGKNGYRKIKIDPDGSNKRKSFWMNRLVYEAFYGAIPAGMQIDHCDGNRANNNLENLIAVTPKQNNMLKKQREKWLFNRATKRRAV